MKAMKLAGLITILLAASVFADGSVNWNLGLRAWTTDGDGNPVDLDLGQPLNRDPAVNPNPIWLDWTVAVAVTGANQGLGGFNISYGFKANDAANASEFGWAKQAIQTGYTDGVSNLDWYYGFKAPGMAGPGALQDPATLGGPGMSVLPQLGMVNSGYEYGAYFQQAGSSYLDWKARRYVTSPTPKKWTGTMCWGVGLDSRKTVLLDNPDGDWVIYTGSVNINAIGWGDGSYTMSFDPLEPTQSAWLIATGVNLNTDQPATPHDMGQVDIVYGAGIDFTIVPEPTTLLLLAGAGLLYRRRRA